MDRDLLRAWLTARSVARAVPLPVRDFGGFRVDTNSPKEARRWVFAGVVSGIAEVARTIREPRHFLKLCGTAAELAACLPDTWIVKDGSWFMAFDGAPAPLQPLPTGYRLQQFRDGPVIRVEVTTDGGELAACGHAAETADAFVYDRIETDSRHRRRGFARAVMAALGAGRRSPSAQQLLVATSEGERLYSNIGWRKLSPYATAYLPEQVDRPFS